MKLITDGYGNWAIKRKRFLFLKEYFDFVCPKFWWSVHTLNFRDCWTDEETAKMWFERLTR